MGYAGLRTVAKPYPTGAHHSVDDEWRRRVQAALDAKGMGRNELAAKVGCHPSAITNVMRPSTDHRYQVQSRLKPDIDRVLGLDDPALGELDAELMRAIRGLDDDMKRHIIGIAEKLSAMTRGSS